jgi:hypothetical protein
MHESWVGRVAVRRKFAFVFLEPLIPFCIGCVVPEPGFRIIFIQTMPVKIILGMLDFLLVTWKNVSRNQAVKLPVA